MKQWLVTAMTTDTELKSSLKKSLLSLLQLPQENREFVLRIISNLTSAPNFPNQGSLAQSIDYLMNETDVPFEEQSILGMHVL